MAKTVLITGGSRGIGRATVRRFAEAGYAVAFTYLHAEKEARELAAETRALAVCADASVSREADRAVAEARQALGHIDVLINNAGISEFSLFTDITDEAWHRMFAVNLDSAFYASRAVLPEMVRRKSGVILNVSSMWGAVGASCEVAYSATKAAMEGMTKALAKEVGPSGIRVCAVAPGTIDTDMNRHLSAGDLAALADGTPLCRIGQPEEIADALFYLASDSASFITGQILAVNGGYIV